MFLSATAAAEWTLRPQAGVGVTDNANHEQDGKNADVFFWVRGAATKHKSESSSSFSLSYQDYISESQNDVFGYRLAKLFPVAWFDRKNWQFEVSGGGQVFTNENPGTTEESFDYVYGQGTLLKTIALNEQSELLIEPYYSVRSYTDFGGRLDHELATRASLTHTLRSKQLLEPFASLGIVRSNQSLYDRNYFEIGTDMSWDLRPEKRIGFGISSRFSTYPNRTVSQTTAVTNKRGKVTKHSQRENETQTYTHAEVFLAKIKASSELKVNLSASTNSSNSGAVDYVALALMGSATLRF